MVNQKILSNSILDNMLKKVAIILIMVMIICNITNQLNQYMKILSITRNCKTDIDAFREMNVTDTVLDRICETTNNSSSIDSNSIRVLTTNMLFNQYQLTNDSKIIYQIDRIKGIKLLERNDVFKDLYDKYKVVLCDIRYFPVPMDTSNKANVTYENSWKKPRTYGGNRIHEGTDIMSSNNLSGYFPIISVSDGTIEQKGWLEQGGYRIGVRSKSGAYFYYAHLDSYQDALDIGDPVKAGDILGYMGSTGYSKIEGTSGNFDVHLHLGIYLMIDGKEVSVNPYWILKYLEDKRLFFDGDKRSDDSIESDSKSDDIKN